MSSKLQSILYRFGSNELDTAIHNEDWSKVSLACAARPKGARRWSTQGSFDGKHSSKLLPLHNAVLTRPPADVVQALIEAYPKAVFLKETGFSRLPIHLCCRSGGSLEVLQVLTKYNPEGAQEKDALGRIPLHYAISNGSVPEIIDELLIVFPDSGRCKDNKGWLPLHVACDCGAAYTVIEKLLKSYPEAALMKTDNRNTALSLLRRSQTPDIDRISKLLDGAATVALRESGHFG